MVREEVITFYTVLDVVPIFTALLLLIRSSIFLQLLAAAFMLSIARLMLFIFIIILHPIFNNISHHFEKE